MSSPVLVFSSVQMEYVARWPQLTERPVRQVFSLRELDYRRLAGGTRAQRLWLRVVMYLLYPLRVFFVSMVAPGDAVLVVSSNTFFAPLLAWAGSRLRRPRVIQWRCDTYPDALVVTGIVRTGSGLERLIGAVQQAINRRCDAVVSVGDFLRLHAERRWGVPRRAFSIDNVPSDENRFRAAVEVWSGPLHFHYGGQLGYMHEPDSLHAVVAEAQRLGPDRVRFDFRMSGAYRDRFARGAEALGLAVDGPVSNAQWKELIAGFQIGFVSLSPGGATVSLPSKIYSMMAGGLAIVAVCPAWSDLARIVEETGCGWVINNSPFATREQLWQGDYAVNCARLRPLSDISAEAAMLFRELVAQPKLVQERRRKAVRAARETFGVASLRRRWAEVFAAVSPGCEHKA